MACNCTNNCDCITGSGSTLTPKVGPTGPAGAPAPQGPQGTTSTTPGPKGVNNTTQGPTGPPGKGGWDSDWKELSFHNGTFGVAPIAGQNDNSTGDSGISTQLRIRVIGRDVWLNGTFLIPLSSDGGATLYPTATLYPIDSQGAGFTQTYLGTNGGFSIPDRNQMTSHSPIIPSDLAPGSGTDFMIDGMRNVERGINPEGQPGSGITLCGRFSSFGLTADGRIYFKGLEYDENLQPGDTQVHNGLLHKVKSRVFPGDKVGTYDNREIGGTHIYNSSYDNEVNDIEAKLSGNSLYYPSEFTADNVNEYGGFKVGIDTKFPVAYGITEQQIMDAFNSI